MKLSHTMSVYRCFFLTQINETARFQNVKNRSASNAFVNNKICLRPHSSCLRLYKRSALQK